MIREETSEVHSKAMRYCPSTRRLARTLPDRL